jgi:UDP-N-acetylglucosamine pyrophosphorylase
MVKICNETDQVFTRCYSCGEWKPATTEYFRKEASPNRDRDFRPLCKKCANEKLKEYLQDRKHKEEMEKMKEVSKETVKANQLFEEKKEDTEPDLRSRLEKFLDSL